MIETALIETQPGIRLRVGLFCPIPIKETLKPTHFAYKHAGWVKNPVSITRNPAVACVCVCVCARARVCVCVCARARARVCVRFQPASRGVDFIKLPTLACTITGLELMHEPQKKRHLNFPCCSQCSLLLRVCFQRILQGSRGTLLRQHDEST